MTPTPEVVSTGRLRADARRNRALVLQAARELYALRGNELTMAEVAARAGVGKATLYRTYPERAQLLSDVAGEQLRAFRAEVRRHRDDDDVMASLLDLFTRLPGQPVTGVAAALFDLESAARDDELATLQRRAMADLDDLLQRGKAQGTVAADASSEHLTVLIAGLGRALPDQQLRDPVVFAQYVTLVLRAFRP